MDSGAPIPRRMLCPIMQEIMFDPVIASDGFTYERPVLRKIFETSHKSPFTREFLDCSKVFEHAVLQRDIEAFLERNPAHQPTFNAAQLEALRYAKQRDIPRFRAIAIMVNQGLEQQNMSSDEWLRQILRYTQPQVLWRENDHYPKPQLQTITPRLGERDGIPAYMICPITQQIMLEPVLMDDGITYEYIALRRFFASAEDVGSTSQNLFEQNKIIHNGDLQREVSEFLESHPNHMPVLNAAQQEAVDRAVVSNIPHFRAMSIVLYDQLASETGNLSADAYFDQIVRRQLPKSTKVVHCGGHGARGLRRYTYAYAADRALHADDGVTAGMPGRSFYGQRSSFIRDQYVSTSASGRPVGRIPTPILSAEDIVRRSQLVEPDTTSAMSLTSMRSNVRMSETFFNGAAVYPEMMRAMFEVVQAEQSPAAEETSPHPTVFQHAEQADIFGNRGAAQANWRHNAYALDDPQTLERTQLAVERTTRRTDSESSSSDRSSESSIPSSEGHRIRHLRWRRRSAGSRFGEHRATRTYGAALHPRLLERQLALPRIEQNLEPAAFAWGSRHPGGWHLAEQVRPAPTTVSPLLLSEISVEFETLRWLLQNEEEEEDTAPAFAPAWQSAQRARRENGFWAYVGLEQEEETRILSGDTQADEPDSIRAHSVLQNSRARSPSPLSQQATESFQSPSELEDISS